MSCDHTIDINALSNEDIKRRSKWLVSRNEWLLKSSAECIKAAFYDNIIYNLKQSLFRRDSFSEFLSKSRTERIVESEWIKMMIEHVNKHKRFHTPVPKEDITPVIPEMPVIHIPMQRRYIGSDIDV